MSPFSAPAELLAGVARALEEIGARWYVFGAQAVAIWGRPRMSADVDVTAAVEPERSGELVEALERHGFELRVRDAADFLRRTRVLPFVHRSTAMPLDVVLAGPGLEERFLDRASVAEIGGASVPVISPEDLIATKILAGRPKDIEDVKGILRERLNNLDLRVIRETLALLEQALGSSDLLRAFEAELAAARRT